jgi:hypothetical protein
MTAGLLARRPIAAPLIPQDRGTRIDTIGRRSI